MKALSKDFKLWMVIQKFALLIKRREDFNFNNFNLPVRYIKQRQICKLTITYLLWRLHQL